MNLVEILTRPEGKTLEFKRDLSSPDGVLKTLVAFANTAGGMLLVGVEDRTRNVRGVSDALDVEERIANIVSDSIAPRLLPEIEILPWRRTQVIAIQIHPSAGRPHYLKREGAESGTYVRVGSTNRRADADMLQELRRTARDVGTEGPATMADGPPLPEVSAIDTTVTTFEGGIENGAADERVDSESLPVAFARARTIWLDSQGTEALELLRPYLKCRFLTDNVCGAAQEELFGASLEVEADSVTLEDIAFDDDSFPTIRASARIKLPIASGFDLGLLKEWESDNDVLAEGLLFYWSIPGLVASLGDEVTIMSCTHIWLAPTSP